MMQGITALPGAQQQNPGQAAPAQVMPPQQGGIAAPITGALEKLPPQQLLSMYNNPQDMTPKWAVATAYAKAVEQARLMQMAQGQSAMAQNQAQSQQPPVAQQVMMQPMPQETQFARHGGIMHGYAGGGAVAFNQGGDSTSPFERWFKNRLEQERVRSSEEEEQLRLRQQISDKYGFAASPLGFFVSQSPEERQKAKDIISRLPKMSTNEMFEVLGQRPPVAPGTENYSHEGQVGLASKPVPPVPYAPVVPESQKDTRQIPPSEVRASAPAGPARPLSTGAAAPAGIASVANQVTLPPIDPYYAQQAKAAEELARSKTEMMKAQGVVSPEVLASRERLRQAQQSAYEPQRKALEEAKAERDAGLFGNAEALGRMAAAVGGTKRFGQGLAAAAGAGSEVVARQRERIEKLGDRYNDLQAQLNLTMAQAQHADVVGDDALKRKALADAEAIKMELFNTKNALRSAAYSQRAQEVQGIAALRKAAADEMSARAHMVSAGKPTAQEALFNRFTTNPAQYEAFIEAGNRPKSEAQERREILRNIVTEAVKNPLMISQLPPEVQALVRQEILKLGVTSTVPDSGKVRE